MENKITDKPEILALTGLRFVAAFYVFIFHMNGRWSITSNQFLGNILSQGAIGMSMFFMLSGFVLTYVYGDGKTSYKNYLVNRFSRIYPLYIFAAVISLPWIKGFLAPTIDIKQIILLIISNILVVQAWIPQFFNYWNDGGSWSISVEFFCYLLYHFPKITHHI